MTQTRLFRIHYAIVECQTLLKARQTTVVLILQCSLSLINNHQCPSWESIDMHCEGLQPSAAYCDILVVKGRSAL